MSFTPEEQAMINQVVEETGLSELRARYGVVGKRYVGGTSGSVDEGAPYELGVGATGPLPRGWHRVIWLDTKGNRRYMITDDIASAALAEVALPKDSIRRVEDVRMESWSDPENGERR